MKNKENKLFDFMNNFESKEIIVSNIKVFDIVHTQKGKYALITKIRYTIFHHHLRYIFGKYLTNDIL